MAVEHVAEAQLERSLRFRDPDTQEAFDRHGFVRVPFLDAPSQERLRRLWSSVAPTSVVGIYSNVHDRNLELNRRIDEEIVACFAKPAHRTFQGAVLGGSSFLVKGTGPNSASTLHQDWNNVDESVSISASIWCPLVDVDHTNGALVVIPGSHRLRRSIRSLDTDSLYIDFDVVDPALLRSIPAAAGEAVIYAHNLFHGSLPNASAAVRVAAVAGVLPKGVPTVHYRRAPDMPDGTFEVLEVDRDFYFGGLAVMKSGQLPGSARPAGTIHLPAFRLSLDDVLGAGSPIERAIGDRR